MRIIGRKLLGPKPILIATAALATFICACQRESAAPPVGFASGQVTVGDCSFQAVYAVDERSSSGQGPQAVVGLVPESETSRGNLIRITCNKSAATFIVRAPDGSTVTLSAGSFVVFSGSKQGAYTIGEIGPIAAEPNVILALQDSVQRKVALLVDSGAVDCENEEGREP